MTTEFSRLPTNVVPSHYHLTIRPEISEFTFSGTETVDVQVRERTKTIVLNSLDIAIQSASFVSNNQEYQSAQIELNKRDEIAVITFADELKVGEGQLKLAFTGEINDLLIGCFRSKYTTADGEERYGLSTQFGSVYCRRAFPCWDEPAIKAKFDLTLVAPKDRVALSNMPVIEETDDPLDSSKRVLKFATTPIMSTYLLCYVIGEYEHIEKTTKNGIPIRVYTAPGKTEQGKFALDVAVRCLDFYEDYFKILYPLPKLDLIAIADFESGAMENWGLVTGSENCILYDAKNSTSLAKQWIAVVVCHELAHQWFGNLVTMDWWKELWLNEGFASFMENHTVNQLLPEFNIWEHFITNSFTKGLDVDAQHSSHPIEVPVNHVSEIDEIFDAVSYWKGASVIRMLYNYLGDEVFRTGMHSYLSKWAYKNTVTEDLWDSLEEASKMPVRSIMSTWIQQKGYPVIQVTCKQHGSNRVLTLTQEKFSSDGVIDEQDRKIKWLVPISIISQGNSKPVKVLLENQSQEVVLEGVQPNEWIKLNPGMTSFYRVNYPPEMLELLQQSIVDKSLNSIDRLNIQNDLYAMVRSGKMGSDRVLKLIQAYEEEDQYPVWDSIIECLGEFNTVLEYTDFQESFHLYARKLLAKIYSKLGSKPVAGEPHQVGLLRSRVFGLLVSCKDPQVLQEAKAQFESHISKKTQIPADLRQPIYRAVIGDCDEKTFELFFQLYRESDLQEEQDRIARSMGATPDPARIQRLVDFAMSTEVRNQDAFTMITSLANSTKVGREIAWGYYKENHEVFTKKYQGGSLLHRLLKNLTKNFASEKHLQDVSAHFAAHPVPSAERAVQQSLESIKANADWLSRDSQTIKSYLTGSSQPHPNTCTCKCTLV